MNSEQDEPTVDVRPELPVTVFTEVAAGTQSGDQTSEAATNQSAGPVHPVAAALPEEEPRETTVELGDKRTSIAAVDTVMPLEIEETPAEQEPLRTTR